MTIAGTVTEYPIPTADSGPQGITAGPDGNIWFTESNTNKIGKFVPTPCGNGHVDPGEQCDDGNRVSGDGCSATCQNECASDAQCPPDQDPCTTASCSTGACTQNPPTGFPGASCVVGQLSAHLPCPGVNIAQKLNLNEKVKRITGWLQRASGANNPNPLLKQSAKLLSQADAQAGRLAKNGRITAACATDAQGRVEEAEVLVNSLRTN